MRHRKAVLALAVALAFPLLWSPTATHAARSCTTYDGSVVATMVSYDRYWEAGRTWHIRNQVLEGQTQATDGRAATQNVVAVDVDSDRYSFKARVRGSYYASNDGGAWTGRLEGSISASGWHDLHVVAHGTGGYAGLQLLELDVGFDFPLSVSGTICGTN